MILDYPLLELILKLISYTILVFGIWTVIEQYTSGRLISKLEIRLHYFTNRDGERILHAPALKEPKVWEIFDVMTAMWILFRARNWAKNSEGGRVLIRPPKPLFPLLALLAPSRERIFHRLRIYLQSNMRQSGNWMQRASKSVSQPESEGDEIEYQFFLSIEHGNPAAKAIYVHILPVDTIDEIVNSKGEFAKTIHPYWSFTEEETQILLEGCKHLQNIRKQADYENNFMLML